MSTAVYVPRVKVLIESPQGASTTLTGGTMLSDITSLEVSKSINRVEGTFNVGLRDEWNGSKQKWSDLIKPNDKVEIHIGHLGTKDMQLVMVGLVDEVGRNDTIASNGTRVVGARVVGRDLTKIFTQFNISNAFTIDKTNAYAAANQIFQGTVFGSNDDIPSIMKAIFDTLKGLNYSRIQFPSWQGQSWLDLVQLECSSPYHILGAVAALYSGPIWGLISEVASPPFHEVWLDTYGGDFILTVRPTPYSTLDALGVPITVAPSNWIQRDLGVNDTEIANVIFVLSRYYDTTQPILDPAFDTDSMNLFGVREKVLRTNIVADEFTPLNQADNPTQAQVAESLQQNRVSFEGIQTSYLNWFKRSDQLKSGYCAVRGNPLYRPGRCVYAPDLGVRFYCQGVRHQMNWGETPNYTTGLTLTRGIPWQMQAQPTN